MTPLQERFLEVFKEHNPISYSEDKEPFEIEAIACSEITLEMMGKFAEWVGKQGWTKYLLDDYTWWKNGMQERITTSELIDEFLNPTK